MTAQLQLRDALPGRRAAAMERDALRLLAEHYDLPLTAVHQLVVERYGAPMMRTDWFVRLPALIESGYT